MNRPSYSYRRFDKIGLKSLRKRNTKSRKLTQNTDGRVSHDSDKLTDCSAEVGSGLSSQRSMDCSYSWLYELYVCMLVFLPLTLVLIYNIFFSLYILCYTCIFTQ